ncbi:MAG: hypothetical protein KGJ23_02745 [Euryarchaeota archaeon]|nr:hypothetical protein [Euryarchaeota archaeon]MDE1835516.1 hypothetical protein [Euryarchaeota archaeon]MDE1879607.1 hypothetical protein [Euryarchaeota archaeon]MDE2043862.1 hypothetical protein [Thermoplasmata archaeon]
MFTILLVAIMLASYLAVQFPAQMEAAEYQHTLQVENEFRELQGDIYAEIAHPNQHVVMTTPITLGSGSVPPFGPASGGILSPPTARAENATFGMSFGQIGYFPPSWGQGNLCPIITGGSCNQPSQSKCSPAFSYNFSGTNSGWNINLNGAGNCYYANFTGSHNVINLTMPSSNFQFIQIIVEGDYNFFNFLYKGGCGAPNIYIFGQRNSYNATIGGGGSCGKQANTTFIGFTNGTIRCPLQNLSNSDTYNVTFTSGNKNVQNITWFNANGWNSAYNLRPPTCKAGCHGQVAFQNISKALSCAWYLNYVNNLNAGNYGGLSARLNNRYSPVVSVNYEEGGLIVGNPINDSTMLSGPLLSVFPSNSGGTGFDANLTIVDFQIQNLTVEQGQGVVGVKTWLVSENSVFFPTGSPTNLGNGNYILTNPQYLNVTTNFAGAWSTWAKSYSSVVTSRPYIHNCFVSYDGYNSCEVSIPFVDAGIYLTVATIGLSFTPE